MAMFNTRRAGPLTLLALFVVAVLGAGAYALRARIAGAPESASRAQGPAHAEGSGAHSHAAADAHSDATAEASQSPSADALPRVEIDIDPRRQQLIGVRTAAVESSSLATTIRTVGLVRYDETRLTDVNLKLEGWITELHVDYTGELVRRGEPLFTLYSPALVTTQQEYLLALETRDQAQHSQIADARLYADRLVESARRRVELWDLPPDVLSSLEETREPQRSVTFRSPASGYVIEKQVLQGMHVMPGQTLYRLADLSGVWLEADVYEQDIRLAKVGQRATVTLDAYPGEVFTGRTIYVYPFLEDRTRTVKVRLALANRRGRLKPGMFANVELQVPMGRGLTVPANALLDSGARQLVFVAEGNGYFAPRDVQVGQRLGDRVQILDGLEEGETVASGATFFIDSESQLRASVQDYGVPPAPAAVAGPREGLAVTFHSEPDPPRAGENLFEVTVKGRDGAPIDDAVVTVVFFMPAMPAMSMPAMRTETALSPDGNGVYRGRGEVMSPGRWDVTVDVVRGGERIGRETFSVVAR